MLQPESAFERNKRILEYELDYGPDLERQALLLEVEAAFGVQNIVFALGLKAVFLVTTLLGLTNFWVVILSDTGAMALVTANALRLLTFKPR